MIKTARKQQNKLKRNSSLRKNAQQYAKLVEVRMTQSIQMVSWRIGSLIGFFFILLKSVCVCVYVCDAKWAATKNHYYKITNDWFNISIARVRSASRYKSHSMHAYHVLAYSK